MASSAHDHHHLHPNPCGPTTAPPPTPSVHPNTLSSTSESADALSILFHRLPPSLSLSLPTRRSPSPKTAASASPPVVSLSDAPQTLRSNLLSASKLGFFQLIHHSISSKLAHEAEAESRSLFNLSDDQKQLYFPKNWPLGFDADEDDEENATGESICLDSSCSTESSAELKLDSLREFTLRMEKVGLEVIGALSSALCFENPTREDPTRVCSLMWISESFSADEPLSPGRIYPYIVGLHYQIRLQKSSLLTDSGWASVSPRVDSILVTFGDIAQVWSNGKIQKVRGRAQPSSNTGDATNISISLLVTLPLETTVSPLLPEPPSHADSLFDDDQQIGDGIVESTSREEDHDEDEKEERVFNSFTFEDYAWRVYHERLHLKDPLLRYRV